MNTLMPLAVQETKALRQLANRLRQHAIRMTAAAGSGHPGGSLGMADVFAALYGRILRHDPKNPTWPDRDRLILSNGHICPVQYAALAETGYFPTGELLTLRKLGSRLQGHPERGALPGLETTSGPLGAGLAQAAGMAVAARMDGRSHRIFCITSDGEHDAGLHWESVLFAGARGLDNLTCLVDCNGIQLSGDTETIMPLGSLVEKYRAFGWEAKEIDAHDFEQIIDALSPDPSRDRPYAVIAKNTPGKGVSFMENDWHWHGKAPNEAQAKQALQELQAAASEST